MSIQSIGNSYASETTSLNSLVSLAALALCNAATLFSSSLEPMVGQASVGIADAQL